MQVVWLGTQIAVTQLLAWQYCPGGQSVGAMQGTQDPEDRSHSSPSGVQVRSEAHLVRQTLAAHVIVVSAQSASVRQPTHRPAEALQT